MSQIVEKTKRRECGRRHTCGFTALLRRLLPCSIGSKIALLFVISTLAMCILLIVVALSDLEGIDRELSQSDETAAVSLKSNVTTKTPSSVLNRPVTEGHKGAA